MKPMPQQIDLPGRKLKNGAQNATCTKLLHAELQLTEIQKQPVSSVGNLSGNRCESDCRSSGHEFDSGLVSYFRGD